MKHMILKLNNKIKKILNPFNSQNIAELRRQFTYVNKAEQLQYLALNNASPGISNEKYCDNEIIVSLTTYGTRLFDVYLTIESIMQQSCKPNKIVLWLSDELSDIILPKTLQNQQERGLEINFCKDIRSYTKLIPTIKKYPDSIIITIDDDALYHFDLVENLIIEHKKYPKLIIGCRIHRMKLKSKNKLKKYNSWISRYSGYDVSPLNFPTGVGGVLYPPNCFNEEVFNEEVFLDICKYADDVWFKAMALYNGTMSKRIFVNTENSIEDNQYNPLKSLNVDKNMNDIQIKAVFDKYNLYNKLV